MKKALYCICLAICLCGCNHIEQQDFDTSYGNVMITDDYDNLSSTIPYQTLNDDDVNTYIENEISSVTGIKASASELTDEVIPELTNGKYSTLTDYRDSVREKLTKENDSAYLYSTGLDIFEQILSTSSIECDRSKVQEKMNSLLAQYENLAQRDGIPLEEYITYDGFDSMEEFDSYLNATATQSIKKLALAESIAKNNDITISDEAVDSYYTNLGLDPAAAQPQDRQEVKNNLLLDAVIRYLASM